MLHLTVFGSPIKIQKLFSSYFRKSRDLDCTAHHGIHTERRQKIIWTTTASAASDNYIVASLFPCHALQAHGYRTIWLWNWRKLVSSFNKRPRLGYERPPGPESCPGCSINCLTVMFVHVLRSVHLEMRIDDGEVYWQTSSFPINFVRETSHSLFSIKL
jgi:hypothetical protein